jgi:hypothetical protein
MKAWSCTSAAPYAFKTHYIANSFYNKTLKINGIKQFDIINISKHVRCRKGEKVKSALAVREGIGVIDV